MKINKYQSISKQSMQSTYLHDTLQHDNDQFDIVEHKKIDSTLQNLVCNIVLPFFPFWRKKSIKNRRKFFENGI